jgi:hypothetical protein
MTRGVLLLIYDLIRMRAATCAAAAAAVSCQQAYAWASWCFRLSDRRTTQGIN